MKEVSIGKDGAVNLIGLDGFVRASRGFKKDVSDFRNTGGVLARIDTAPSGSFVSPGAVDGVKRVLAYRKVAGLPLVVVVGLGVDEVLAPFFEDALKYIATGIAITILVIVVMLASTRHRKSLSHAYLALRLLGYPRVRNYLGSWKEWGNRTELPVEIPKEAES